MWRFIIYTVNLTDKTVDLAFRPNISPHLALKIQKIAAEQLNIKIPNSKKAT